MIVADTNLIAYFFIPGQHTATAKSVFLSDRVILSAFPKLAVHNSRF
jgi:hypothetical protein